MRRLVGLIALLALIIGAAWLVRDDLDLRRIAVIDELLGPAGRDEAMQVPMEGAAVPAEEEPAVSPDVSATETELATAPESTTSTSASGETPEGAAPAGVESAEAGVADKSETAEITADGATVPEASAREAEAATAPHDAAPAAASGDALEAATPDHTPPAEFDTAASESGEMAGDEAAALKAETVTAPGSASVETETSMVEPAAESESTPEAAPPVGVVPSFDIVRVEPSGETVIAGVAAPQSTVEVLNGPDPVATAEANERGEWALVLEAPLPPGTHDLAIRTTSEDRSQVTLSDQRVAVSVPEAADEEPLVVLNEPNAPSRVIQVPAEGETPAAGPEVASAPEGVAPAEMPASSADTDLAAVPPAAPTDGEAGPEVAAASAPPAETEVASAPEAMTETIAPPAESGARPVPSDQASSATEIAPAPMAGPSAPTGSPEAAADSSDGPIASDLAAPPAASAEVVAAPEPERMTAPSTPSGGAEVAATPAAPSGEPAPDTMDTAAAPGAAITDDAMADPPTDRGGASEGVAEAASETPPPAGVPTETEVATVSPSGEEAAAAPDTAAAESAETEASGQPAEAEPPAVVEETPQAAPQVGIAAVEAETNGALYIAGTATTPEPVRVYVDEEFIGEAEPSESGTWLVEADREMAPAEYAIRADQVDTGTGVVIARAEVPFEREIVVATVTQTGETVDPGGAEVAGSVAGPTKVIIKRGDNLWRISREIYGRGIRYATIYRANRDQIRNPNLIYPGQVFILPTGDTAWESQ